MDYNIRLSGYYIRRTVCDACNRRQQVGAIEFPQRQFPLLADLSLQMYFGRTAQLATFTSTKLTSALWLLLWGLVILELYQANLKAYLSVSNRLNLPFTDFEGFIEQLRYIFTF